MIAHRRFHCAAALYIATLQRTLGVLSHAPRPTTSRMLARMSVASAAIGSTQVNGVLTTSHAISVPLDHAEPHGEKIDVFVREVTLVADDGKPPKPALLYLQGGPGFPAMRPTFPLSGWMKSASTEFRILLMDQRGTGLSNPITPATLAKRFGPQVTTDAAAEDAADSLGALAERQAAFLGLFRADSIVRDCEVVRRALVEGAVIAEKGSEKAAGKWTLLGQSFGGFCCLTYLSLYPEALERVLFTVGLAPVLRSADEVYEATFKRMATRNRRFFERYPDAAAAVRRVALHLDAADRRGASVALPSGGALTLRRFQLSGLLLGSGDGMERLYFLLEDAWAEDGLRVAAGGPGEPSDQGDPGGRGAALSTAFLSAMDGLLSFETNPLYWLLHESIYADGPGAAPTAWAAHRVQQALAAAAAASAPSPAAAVASPFDARAALAAGGVPYFTGEMVYPGIGEDGSAALGGLRGAADVLAARADWGALYDAEALRGVAERVPCAALVSYDDVFVERAFSLETAELLNGGGGGCRVWITNEFQHSGLRDCPARVFETLLAMAKGELAIPS